jgi:hypothetical protein
MLYWLAGCWSGNQSAEKLTDLQLSTSSHWSALGAGLGKKYECVWQLIEYKGELIACGIFSRSGAEKISALALLRD